MNPLASSKCVRRVLMALAAISGIFLTASCGSSGLIIRSLGGSFSKASLNGQYVIALTGIGAEQSTVGTGTAPFSETIVFTADGKGILNETCDDFDQVGGPFGGCSLNVAGTYTIASDGTGSINIGGRNGFNYAITMIDDQHFYIIEQDVFETASGFGEMQDTTAFTAAPSGTFVFKAHDTRSRLVETTITTSSRVGGITITSGVISGTEDLLTLGLLSSSNPIATSAALTAPDANGRGQFTLTDGSSFNYYIVNSSKFHFMSNSSSGSLEIGQAEAQIAPASGFSAATLPPAGSYVFGSSGDTSFPLGIHSAGVFTTDGNGNFTGGAVDYVQDATVNSNLAVAGGTYTLASNGRGTTNLTLTGGTISPQIFWMVNETSAYFLANSTAAVEDGTFSLQSGGPFTALTSQTAFVMDGFDVTYKDRVGAFKPATSGFNWNQAYNSFDPNLGGNPSALATNGTYTVSSNGRVAVNVNNVTPSLVFYLSSANSGFMVQEDADIGGAFTVQASQ